MEDMAAFEAQLNAFQAQLAAGWQQMHTMAVYRARGGETLLHTEPSRASHVATSIAKRRRPIRHSALAPAQPSAPPPFARGDVICNFLNGPTRYGIVKLVRRAGNNAFFVAALDVRDRNKEEGTVLSHFDAKFKVQRGVWDCAWHTTPTMCRMFRALQDVEAMIFCVDGTVDVRVYVHAPDCATRRERLSDFMAVTVSAGGFRGRVPTCIDTVLTGQATRLKCDAVDEAVEHARQVSTVDDFDLIRRWKCYLQGPLSRVTARDVDAFLGWFYAVE